MLRFLRFAGIALVACGETPLPAAPPCPGCPIALSPPTESPSVAAPVSTAPAVVASKPPEPPPALKEALAAAANAIETSNWTVADKSLAAASAAAGDEPHLGYLVTRVRATRFVYAGDFEKAASAYVSIIPLLAKHPELPDEFWSHNAMMMIREAQGDPAAALAENDQATLCAARGTWGPDRETLAFQKDRWHRAYLTRMLAESRSGTAKQGLVLYAQAALDDYRTRGFPESIAILDAYFAALDGKKEAALAAAKRVDPAKDDDIEDLYLVVVGLEAGGDHAAADAVRKQMKQMRGVYSGRAIMLRWIDLDVQKRGFTPWHATAR